MKGTDITGRILASPKYRGIDRSVIENAVAQAIEKYGEKGAEKAARSKLHELSEAYFAHKELGRLEELLRRLPGDEAALESALSLHASTRERLPLSDFDAVLSRAHPGSLPDRVLDIGCGINPIYLICRGCACTGLDANAALMDLIAGWSPMADMRACDAADPGAIPQERYPLALVMKLLPLLETRKKGQGRMLLDEIRAERILVSFPTRTLGGRRAGMEEHYRAMLSSVMPERLFEADSFETRNELFFVLKER